MIGRSRSSVTADRKVELTAAVSLAATTGGLFFPGDEGQHKARQCGEAQCSSRKMPCQVPSCATSQALAIARDELAAAEEQWLTLEMLREQIDDDERKS